MKKTLSFSLCFIMLFSSCTKKEAADKTDYTTINSSWECDYFKIGVNSNWNITENIDGNYISVTWDRNGASPIFFNLSYTILQPLGGIFHVLPLLSTIQILVRKPPRLSSVQRAVTRRKPFMKSQTYSIISPL